MKPKIELILHLLIFLLYLNFCSGNMCTREQDCTKCIAKADCAWCSNPEFQALNHPEGGHPRCNTIEGHSKQKYCSLEYLENPQSRREITPSAPSSGKKLISPQNIKAQLRVGKPVEFELTYVESENKPLDLYYIMDLSATMEDDKGVVASQGRDLALALKKITSDLQIGFGSFIDKPVMPFVSSTQLEGKVRGEHSVAPYGFKNHLNLTSVISRFTDTVNNAQISANLDAPEGGLDAIMQAIACDGKNDGIGWREKARKLIVLATDGPFHIAGDGKLGGIVRPNDGECHMDGNIYSHSKLLDYPSVAQLNSKVLEKKAHVIFAIASEHLALYQQLSKRITNSAAAGLFADSTNVVKLVRDEYQKISEFVKISPEPTQMPFLSINFYADCGNNGKFVPSNQCEKVKVGQTVKFKIKVELTRCPKRAELSKPTFTVDFTTFELSKKDFLRLEVEPLCTCGCSKEKQLENNPQKVEEICRAGAFMQCGLCHCSSDRQGRNCECSKNGDESEIKDKDAPCRKPNSTEICSNRGKCECGVCKCNNDLFQYSGKFCQFDDSSCRVEGSYEPCSNHGDCEEGKCSCRPAGVYEGDKCQCSSDKNACVEPGSNANNICNGNGDCSCSENRKCDCKPNYTGLYCQKCSTGCGTASPSGSRCADKKLQDCVKCHLHNKLNYDKDQKEKSNCAEECKISSKAGDVDTVQINYMESIRATDNEIRCPLKYNDTCVTEFLYSYLPNPRYSLNVAVSTSLTCSEPPPILWYIFGVIGGVLLIGILLLLLWKLLTHIHDKREFSRFEKERAGARWDKGENPLYTDPTREFQNPAYKG